MDKILQHLACWWLFTQAGHRRYSDGFSAVSRVIQGRFARKRRQTELSARRILWDGSRTPPGRLMPWSRAPTSRCCNFLSIYCPLSLRAPGAVSVVPQVGVWRGRVRGDRRPGPGRVRRPESGPGRGGKSAGTGDRTLDLEGGGQMERGRKGKIVKSSFSMPLFLRPFSSCLNGGGPALQPSRGPEELAGRRLRICFETLQKPIERGRRRQRSRGTGERHGNSEEEDEEEEDEEEEEEEERRRRRKTRTRRRWRCRVT